MEVDLVIAGAAEIFTAAPDVGSLTPPAGGGVAVDDGLIVAIGDISGYRGRRTIAADGCVVMPGFVDAHTHVVFGGSRSAEYAAKVAGWPVPEGAASGIVGTMRQTRAATAGELLAAAAARVAEMVAHGTTTLEAKTGYGLSVEAEEKLLAVHEGLAGLTPATVVTTYLGAHAVDPDADRTRWVDEIVTQVGEVGAAGRALFNDVYCDVGYFSLAETERIARAGMAVGLPLRMHLDAYSHTGAAALTADLPAASADHLNYTTDAELRALGEAGVVGVAIPVLEYAVAHPAPLDPRRVRDAGMTLALATDICPGAWNTSMQLVVAMACRTGGLTVAEALTAATHGSAVSLGMGDVIGSLEVGKRADLLVLDVPSHEDVAYRIGRNNVRDVIKDGRVIAGDPH